MKSTCITVSEPQYERMGCDKLESVKELVWLLHDLESHPTGSFETNRPPDERAVDLQVVDI